MTLAFIFPRGPINPDVDEAFVHQKRALEQAGFKCWLDDPLKYNEDAHPSSFTAVRRTWMETAAEYGPSVSRIEALGVIPFTSLTGYLATHYLTRWFELLQDLTPATKFSRSTEELVNGFLQSGWKKAVIKDWVKSLKSKPGPVITNGTRAEVEQQANLIVNTMRHYRGHIEGGLSLREWEPLDHETERRFFVINGRPYSHDATQCPEIVHSVARRITLSQFFSVDIALRTSDQSLRVIEIGDGQVSDLVGWSAERFAEIWKESQ